MFICWFCLRIFSNYHFTQMASYFMGNKVRSNEENAFWAQTDMQAVTVLIVTKYLNYLEPIVNEYRSMCWRTVPWADTESSNAEMGREIQDSKTEMLRIRGRSRRARDQPRAKACNAPPLGRRHLPGDTPSHRLEGCRQGDREKAASRTHLPAGTWGRDFISKRRWPAGEDVALAEGPGGQK